MVGPQPADIGERNDYNILMYLTTTHDFENYGVGNCPVVPLVVDLTSAVFI